MLQPHGNPSSAGCKCQTFYQFNQPNGEKLFVRVSECSPNMVRKRLILKQMRASAQLWSACRFISLKIREGWIDASHTTCRVVTLHCTSRPRGLPFLSPRPRRAYKTIPQSKRFICAPSPMLLRGGRMSPSVGLSIWNLSAPTPEYGLEVRRRQVL